MATISILLWRLPLSQACVYFWFNINTFKEGFLLLQQVPMCLCGWPRYSECIQVVNTTPTNNTYDTVWLRL